MKTSLTQFLSVGSIVPDHSKDRHRQLVHFVLQRGPAQPMPKNAFFQESIHRAASSFMTRNKPLNDACSIVIEGGGLFPTRLVFRQWRWLLDTLFWSTGGACDTAICYVVLGFIGCTIWGQCFCWSRPLKYQHDVTRNCFALMVAGSMDCSIVPRLTPATAHLLASALQPCSLALQLEESSILPTAQSSSRRDDNRNILVAF